MHLSSQGDELPYQPELPRSEGEKPDKSQGSLPEKRRKRFPRPGKTEKIRPQGGNLSAVREIVFFQIVFVSPQKAAEPPLGIFSLAKLSGRTGTAPESTEMGKGNVLPQHFPQHSPGLTHETGMPHSPGQLFGGGPFTEPAPEVPENDPVIRRIDLAAQGAFEPLLLQPFREKTHQPAPGINGTGLIENFSSPELLQNPGALFSRGNDEEGISLPERGEGGIFPYFMHPGIGMQNQPHENLLSAGFSFSFLLHFFRIHCKGFRKFSKASEYASAS